MKGYNIACGFVGYSENLEDSHKTVLYPTEEEYYELMKEEKENE